MGLLHKFSQAVFHSVCRRREFGHSFYELRSRPTRPRITITTRTCRHDLGVGLSQQ